MLLLVASILVDDGAFPAFRVDAVGLKDMRSSNASSCCAVMSSSSSHVPESDEQSSLAGAVVVDAST